MKKRKRKFSANQHSLEYWRGIGAVMEITERRIPKVFITKDAFGFADLMGVHPLYVPGTLYIQTTTAAHIMARVKKIASTPEIMERVKRILACQNTVIVEGWARRMKRGRCVQVERIAYQIKSVDPLELIRLENAR